MTESSPKRSSIKRVAEFIASVGEGNKFKKMELFAAVEGVSQADRRMRDLREMGWEIDNYKVNPNISPDEYLIKKIGVRIDLGEPRPKSARKSITGPKRRRIFERDGHTCQVCGAPAGVPFPDDPSRVAILTIGHIVPKAWGGPDDDGNLRAECQRCGDESRNITKKPPTADEVLVRAQHVGSLKEKRRLFGWMQAGRRSLDDTEDIFNDWAKLPHAQRLEVMSKFAQQVITDMDAK